MTRAIRASFAVLFACGFLALLSPYETFLRSHLRPEAANTWESYLVYLGVVAAGAFGVLVASIADRALLARNMAGVRVIAPLLSSALAALFASRVALWLAFASIGLVIVTTPLLSGEPTREDASTFPPELSPRVTAAFLGACVGTFLFVIGGPDRTPIAPLLAGGGAFVGYALSTRAATGTVRVWCERLVPLAFLPLTGLLRNPASTNGLIALGASGLLVLAERRAEAPEPSQISVLVMRVVRVLTPIVSIAGGLSICILPFAFRDLPGVDHLGHEAQHLGWLNSVSHGSFLFADAGFIYGPLREYTLYTFAKVIGGLDLAHVRIAQIAMNVTGLSLLAAALLRITKRPVLVLAMLALLLLHTPLSSFITYYNTYSLGWADAARAGLPCLALALGLVKDAHGKRALSFPAMGVLLGLSALYSHDFGLLAIASGGLGVLATAWQSAEGPLGTRTKLTLRAGVSFALGVGVVLGAFAAIYAVAGRGHRLLLALRWVTTVASGHSSFGHQLYPISVNGLRSFQDVTMVIEPDGHIGTTRLDYMMGPLIAGAGALVCAARFVSKARGSRFPAIVAFTMFALLVLRHPFLTADGWHLSNATTPSLLLLAILLEEASRALSKAALASLAAASLTAFWLAYGAIIPVGERLRHFASGEEHPSIGAPYTYPDLPRAGDVRVPTSTREIVAAIQREAGPDGTAFSTTWMMGGGAEAFLANRRNPTGIDVPHEVVTLEQQRELLRVLKEDPPTVIFGDSFEYYGDEVRAYVGNHWDRVPVALPAPLRRYRGK